MKIIKMLKYKDVENFMKGSSRWKVPALRSQTEYFTFIYQHNEKRLKKFEKAKVEKLWEKFGKVRKKESQVFWVFLNSLCSWFWINKMASISKPQANGLLVVLPVPGQAKPTSTAKTLCKLCDHLQPYSPPLWTSSCQDKHRLAGLWCGVFQQNIIPVLASNSRRKNQTKAYWFVGTQCFSQLKMITRWQDDKEMKLIDKHPQNESETDKKNSYSSLILITNWKSCCVKKHFLQTKCIEQYCPATPWALRSTLNCVSWKLPIRMLPAYSLYLTEAERNEKEERTMLCLINHCLLKQDQTILQNQQKWNSDIVLQMSADDLNEFLLDIWRCLKEIQSSRQDSPQKICRQMLTLDGWNERR